jgi:hypothetical protein
MISGDKFNELMDRKFIKDENYEKDMAPAFAKKNEFLAF